MHKDRKSRAGKGQLLEGEVILIDLPQTPGVQLCMNVYHPAPREYGAGADFYSLCRSAKVKSLDLSGEETLGDSPCHALAVRPIALKSTGTQKI